MDEEKDDTAFIEQFKSLWSFTTSVKDLTNHFNKVMKIRDNIQLPKCRQISPNYTMLQTKCWATAVELADKYQALMSHLHRALVTALHVAARAVRT